MFWVSQFLVNAAPVLISVAFQSARITGADISYSSPSLLSTAQTQPPILVTFGLVITAAALAALAFRRFSVFGGLWLALPGYVACSQPILDAVFVPSLFHARDWLALLCSFGAAVAGLRLIVGSLKPAGYWTRLGVLRRRPISAPSFKAATPT